MLPLSTKRCLNSSKLRPILNGQFCHPISKNICLIVLGSKQPWEILVFVIFKLEFRIICSCSNFLKYMENFEYRSILVDSGSIVHWIWENMGDSIFYPGTWMSHRQTHRQTHRHTQTEKRAKTVLLKIHFQPFWTLLVDCSHVISQMVRFGSFSCGPHIGHVMINFLFILESTVYDCLNHKMTVFGPKKAKCGRNITIPKWPKW